jgi:hypothetical protein
MMRSIEDLPLWVKNRAASISSMRVKHSEEGVEAGKLKK